MKLKGFLAYFFGLLGGLIVYFTAKEDEGTLKFHAAQSMTLSIANYVIGIVCGFIPGIGGTIAAVVSLIAFILVIMGIVKVVKEDTELELPIVGELTHSIFKI